MKKQKLHDWPIGKAPTGQRIKSLTQSLNLKKLTDVRIKVRNVSCNENFNAQKFDYATG